MLRSLLLIVATALVVQPAFAADLPSRLPPPTPPSIAPLPAFTWTGFYVGGNAGGAFRTKDVVGIHYDPRNVFVGNFGTLHPGGALGGGQVGYNYQWGNIVVGAEADFQGSGIEDTARAGAPAPLPGTVTTKSRIDYFGTARLRLGYAFGHFLAYATGGFGYGHLDYTLSGGAPNGFNTALRDRSIRGGESIGAGLEYALSDHWTIKAEYLHVGLSGKTVSATVFRNGARVPFTVRTVESPEFDLARAGVNYKF